MWPDSRRLKATLTFVVLLSRHGGVEADNDAQWAAPAVKAAQHLRIRSERIERQVLPTTRAVPQVLRDHRDEEVPAGSDRRPAAAGVANPIFAGERVR
jgi:hypothetical protein